ncbi:sigma-70 family RNA polymerase sigma factor [Micromonospora sp. U56]|uniref:RNA polymerase sigma factor n=1 Tax=Micromonospora sp. U56 TaxID=2824900 RepID=UPI001B387BB3|nr:sigma-70 family RNA polymerase sigma factor [Micromonospora sp. U56]MBQ0894647.1 sigma-70 family RNA polymerase sigma factor [Micromonospora sp. U56]
MVRADKGLAQAVPAPHADATLPVASDVDEFIDSTYPSLLKTALIEVRNIHEAEDVVNQVMMELLRKWDTIAQTVENPLAYARTALINRIRKNRTREAERLPRTLRGGHLTPAGFEDTSMTAWEEREWVLQHLKQLPHNQRAVMAYEYDGLTPNEIAVKLGKKPANVRKLLQLARDRLKVELERELRRENDEFGAQGTRKETR